MSAQWLDIIGLTEAEAPALPAHLRAILGNAEVIVGPQRLIDKLPEFAAKTMAWQTPFSAMLEQIAALKGTKTVILATGDPNWFGIGASLARHFSSDEFTMHPAPSSFQLAGARLHWPLQNCATISLHGRDVATIQKHIAPGARILALTSDRQTMGAVAAILKARGYGDSQLSILQNLGAPNEQIDRFKANAIANDAIGDFYVLAIDCVAAPSAPLLAQTPGLPDDAFVSDGQLTKREVRAASLAKLAPHPGALLWDVGAGCGAIGIEWMRAAANAKAICFERDTKRLQMIAENSNNLGTPDLRTIAGEAPKTLADQPAPDAIFMGGAVGDHLLFDACWQALKPGGRLVANAVTIEGETALYQRHEKLGGEITRIDIAHLDHIGTYRAMRPRMAVTQWLIVKGT